MSGSLLLTLWIVKLLRFHERNSNVSSEWLHIQYTPSVMSQGKTPGKDPWERPPKVVYRGLRGLSKDIIDGVYCMNIIEFGSGLGFANLESRGFWVFILIICSI